MAYKAEELGLRCTGIEATGLGEVARAARKSRADGIYPTVPTFLEPVAVAAAELGLPGLGPAAAACVSNKLTLRSVLQANGIRTPAYRHAGCLDDVRAVAEGLGLPVIVKPVDAAGSAGLWRLDYLDDFPLAFAKALKHSPSDMVLIETCVDGDEFAVDCLIGDQGFTVGGITRHERSAPPHCYAVEVSMPPQVDATIQNALVETAHLALEAIGFGQGAARVKLVAADDGPVVIDVDPFPVGGVVPVDLIPQACGLDFMADALRVAVGEPQVEERRWNRGAALRWIPSRTGIVREVRGLEAARAVPDVVEVAAFVKPGQVIGHAVDCATRDAIGYVLAVSDDVADAIAAVRQATGLCEVITETAVTTD